MVGYLLKDVANEESTLKTREHCEWVMQIFGRCFSLPITNKSRTVISGAITLYKKWMHLPTAPQPIQKEPLYFSKKMCCHLSFVFGDRGISAVTNEFQVHVVICQRVLGIYSKSARAPPPNVTDVEWNEFLARIFLGICDEVMKGPADSRSLGNDIEQDVFFCMFDIWMRSKMQNETLWNTLVAMANKEWIHRRWFIESWGQCCVALTRKLLNVLYGGDNGADAVFVFWPVLGTNVISIDAMLAGRGSMIASTRYNKPQIDHNQDYDVVPNRFGSRSMSTVPDSPNGNGGKSNENEPANRPPQSTANRGPLSMATYIQIEDSRLLIYLWNSMLNLLDINAINDPECFGCGIAWISRMVDMFLGINITCKQRKDGTLPANGNSILDIFNHELFTAAVNMNGFEEARAIALGGLCRIFVSKCDTIFKSEYLLNFYHTLHELLKNPNSIEETAREQVILNAATLFACDFDGCRALITIFLPHIGIILRKPQKPRLRLAAITMLCSFISLEWHFYNAEVNASASKLEAAAGAFAVKPKDANDKKHEQLSKLRDRLKLISTIIYDAIQTETNEYNLQKLLWCCSVFLIISSKHISRSNPFSSSLVRTIWKHIEEEAGHWPCHVITTAFKALAHVIEHVVCLDAMHNDSVLNWQMFIEMCKYAQVHLEPGTQFDIDSRRVLSVACMKCLSIWLKNDPSLIITNKAVSKALRDLIRHAIKIKASRGQFIGSINADNDNVPAIQATSHTDADLSRSNSEQPPMWDAMAFKSTASSNSNINENSNALKDVYRATDQLARFFTNDIGAYYQYKKQSISNSPMHRYAEAYLNEQQIEDHIWKSLHGNNLSDKWQSNDRIRYFAYKKNRIITMIEMPRLHQLQQQNSNSKLSTAASAQSPMKDIGDKPPMKQSKSDPAKSNGPQRHPLQHLEPRHCDVIVLIRDAYGKYAWEVSGIFNDFDTEKEVAEIVATTTNIIDNSKPVTKGTRTEFGNMRQDKVARSMEKAQILAQQKNYHHNALSEDGQEGKANDDDSKAVAVEKLMASKLVTANDAKSSAAYWSSTYTKDNWRYRQLNEKGLQQYSVLIQKSMAAQENMEKKNNVLYTKWQQHPLKNAVYQQQQTECKSNSNAESASLDTSVAHSNTVDLFSASEPHKPPTQDDAATFMHSRRLLSTLGFLRPNQATGVARFVDILDQQPQNYNIGTDKMDMTLMDYLSELDRITSLDQIGVSILYHNDGESQLSDFDILASPKSKQKLHSGSFEYFLTSMANRVAIKTHVGYKGVLTNKDCDKFPYYSDSICGELAYIVPSELKSTVTLERKKSLYLSSCIRIIWSETAPTDSSPTSSSINKNCPLWLSQQFIPTNRHPNPETPIIYIRITAQSHGLYRVSINGESVLPHLLGASTKKKKRKDKKGKKHRASSLKTEESEEPIISTIGAVHTNTTTIPTTGFERVIIGPLVDGMVISESVLPDLVRKTIVNASNLISELMNDSLSIDAKEKRERIILEIASKFEKYRSSDREKYYQWFFMNPDQTTTTNTKGTTTANAKK
eukprot:CAMPEP_0197023226 /NCGR_PEP_ID=MMETSP1384-20130603/3991_1 /TAXON_ID=29189 /ORGANISM="Ammonia sp." /LENGTH=1535 /DNA_ID=CAMNT_0042451417 /DNA_START=138 /DNA_END=4745 /DNA_ORIENTATION=+